MVYSALSNVDLVLQLVTLGFLLFGVYQMLFRRNYKLHGTFVTLALVLNILSIILVMVPNLGSVNLAISYADWQYYYILAHHAIGLIALVMAIFMVTSWLLSGAKPLGCPGKPEHKKTIMLATFSMWFLSIIMGVVMYLMYI